MNKKKAAAAVVEQDDMEAASTSAAAEALITMRTQAQVPTQRVEPMDRVFSQVMNLTSDWNDDDEVELEDEDEDEEVEEEEEDAGEEEEIDEINHYWDDEIPSGGKMQVFLYYWLKKLTFVSPVVPVGSPEPEWSKEETFDIPFEVPFKNAKRDLSGINSKSSFTSFLRAAAERMGTRVTLLTEIAYIASFAPKSPKPVPKLLEDEKGWKTLIGEVWEYIKQSKAKNKGKGTVKAFRMILVDTSGIGIKSDEKDKGKKVSFLL